MMKRCQHAAGQVLAYHIETADDNGVHFQFTTLMTLWDICPLARCRNKIQGRLPLGSLLPQISEAKFTIALPIWPVVSSPAILQKICRTTRTIRDVLRLTNFIKFYRGWGGVPSLRRTHERKIATHTYQDTHGRIQGHVPYLYNPDTDSYYPDDGMIIYPLHWHWYFVFIQRRRDNFQIVMTGLGQTRRWVVFLQQR